MIILHASHEGAFRALHQSLNATRVNGDGQSIDNRTEYLLKLNQIKSNRRPISTMTMTSRFYTLHACDTNQYRYHDNYDCRNLLDYSTQYFRFVYSHLNFRL